MADNRTQVGSKTLPTLPTLPGEEAKIEMRVLPTSYEFNWRHAERALVAVGQPTVGIAVVLPTGLLLTPTRVGLKAAVVEGPQLTVKVTAGDDGSWRGAEAGVLAKDNGIAVLGPAEWLDGDAREALDRLLHERFGVDVAVLHDRVEIVIAVPMPNGSWLRFPAAPYTDRLLVVRAKPLPGCEVVFDLLDGAPAFSEEGRLVGFMRVLRSPRPRQLIVVVVRADVVIGFGWWAAADSQPFTRSAGAA